MFKEKYNTLKIERLISNLKTRGMNGHYCKGTDEMMELVAKLSEGAKSIAYGGSMTVDETGVKDFIKAIPGAEFIDRDNAKDAAEKEELNRKAFFSDVYFMSTNAISEDGILVNIDGLGNRVAALSYGPKKVIMIVGVNKITSTLDEAILRARTVAAPINVMRLNKNTPCNVTGQCANCQSPESICSQILVTRRSMDPDRIHIILVDDEFGY